MMKILLFLLGSISLAAVRKCEGTTNHADKSKPLVQLETFGCRGFCPTYKLVISNEGMVTYEGIRNMVKMGLDTVELTVGEFKRLRAALKEVNLWQYPERFESQIADAPTAALTVFDVEKSHKITGAIERPKPVLAFEALLKDLAEAHGLKVKEGVNPYQPPANQQEVTVKFKPEINPGNFMMQFEEIRLRIVRRVSAENVWIIGYNPDQISEEQLTDMLIGMEGVLEAGSKKK